MSNVSKRILARRAAVQILYQSEITGVPADKLVDEGLVPEEAKANEYARELVCGVSAHRAELDRAIGESSQNWAIDRMPVVDRSVLRLAVYEMRYVDDVPQSVAINEAVELAKAFGGEDDSHRFVNGILGRLARLSESEQGVAAEALPRLRPPRFPRWAFFPTLSPLKPIRPKTSSKARYGLGIARSRGVHADSRSSR